MIFMALLQELNRHTIKKAIKTLSDKNYHAFPKLFYEVPDQFFCLFRAVPMAYGGSQARGLIGAVAASLLQSHSNAGSEPPLRPTPQLVAMPDL